MSFNEILISQLTFFLLNNTQEYIFIKRAVVHTAMANISQLTFLLLNNTPEYIFIKKAVVHTAMANVVNGDGKTTTAGDTKS